jgi:type IV fimbrial biogenesis protein FimT
MFLFICKTQDHYQAKGFTLIELLMTLLLFSSLLGISIAPFHSFYKKRLIKIHINHLFKVLQHARLTAITSKQIITVCPSHDQKNCQSNWSKGYISFIDYNHNRQRDSNDRILLTYKNTHHKMKLKWRAFGIKKSLQWLDTGITNHQNGTFQFCHSILKGGQRALIINKSGRIRFSHQARQNENSKWKPLKC